jgi:hypothetical protein
MAIREEIGYFKNLHPLYSDVLFSWFGVISVMVCSVRRDLLFNIKIGTKYYASEVEQIRFSSAWFHKVCF